MSVKIYTGIKITDFNKFMEELNHLKSRILTGELDENSKGKTMFEELIDMEVRAEVGENNLKAYKDKVLDFLNNKGDIGIYWKTEELIELHIGVYPNGLGIVYDKISPGIESNYRRILDFESVEEYGYWDNVDMPEDVKEWEWDMRRIAWENAIGEYTNIYKEFDNRLLIEVIKEEFDYKKAMKIVGMYKNELDNKKGDEIN